MTTRTPERPPDQDQPVNTPAHQTSASPVVTVDVVALSVADGRLWVLLVPADTPPVRGRRSLPGGPLAAAAGLDQAAADALADVGVHSAHLEQVGAFTGPPTSQRGPAVSVAYLALLPDSATPHHPGAWRRVDEVVNARPGLAYGQREIVAAAVERLRDRIEHTTVAAALCGPEFTVIELRQVYEAVWERPLNPPNFHRKVTHAAGFLEPTGNRALGNGGRPPALYRQGTATTLHPPMLRDQVY